MVLIFDNADFWIESHVISVTVQDAAGRSNSAIQNLDKPGHYVGAAQVCQFAGNNDASFGIGTVEILDQSATSVIYGEEISGIRVRVTKVASTAGAQAINFTVIVFMRK